MVKLALILYTVVIAICSAEVSSYDSREIEKFKTDLNTPLVDKSDKSSTEGLKIERRPVYNPEENRVKNKPIRTTEFKVQNEKMLSDQPFDTRTEVDRVDNVAIPGYGFVPTPMEVAYPDVPYAPGYPNYNGYSGLNSYDNYENSPSSYYMEPDVSPLSFLWSQVPDSRMIGSLLGNTISWLFGSIFTLLLGTLLTFGVCTYTDICTITVNGVGPIHEEMRSIITPARLEKIGHAADFVKTAIDKYQQIQTLGGGDAMERKRRLTSVS
ncbi:hypothetical protein ACJJTC_019809 [Scirpophaga incertulas]